MTRRRVVPTLLALAGTLLTAWQCHVVYLPLHRAGAFDWCQISPSLDCIRSLNASGATMTPFGVPAFPALAALFGFMLVAHVLGHVRGGERARGLHAWAGLASFPAAGLALYVVLHDLLEAKVTSPSALAVVVVALAAAALAATGGLRGWRARGVRTALGATAVAAALAAFLVHGAGLARLESARAMRERRAAPPQVRWPRFAIRQPRVGAAVLGDPRARAEVLLFVDLADPDQLRLAREARAAVAGAGDRLRVVLYARGALGTGLVEAARDGRTAPFLADPGAGTGPVRPALVDPAEWRERAGVAELPAAVWDGGRAAGRLDLDAVLARAAAGR